MQPFAHGFCAFFVCLPSLLLAADVIPHAQDKPPNEPRDAETAARMMTVPPGFVVDVVAAEPDVVNPVAMAIDEKGRFWITESLEYPRRSPGPGKDRVKLLEDTDGDGRVDKTSIFLDGLNIPSGVQVGHGGVWIANAPDLLFVPDADRDGVSDGPPEVVVTGFGRDDTHELPNSLTWGPDGWLYGLNGVFNHSHVHYSKSNPNFDERHPGWKFTCAMFRIHPRTREFQIFCEGTSNPWGIAFNDEGDAFVSACVIDHLWHFVETGYYHRQGGPYPPHTWKIESIVKHKHQKAAYCGITWFDSDAYPEQYRKKLYMGNIHGGCINVDRIERNGSTYAGFGEPDFLTANDTWFMPVVQKTGKDGCLYILDWYDRYHCYQDANRDPAGIDRLKGRLYRVRYVGTNEPEASATDLSSAALPQDLSTAGDDTLINWLGHPNVWVRETAQRLLEERFWKAGTDKSLQNSVLRAADEKSRSLMARRLSYRIAANGPEYQETHCKQSIWNDDPQIRAWAVRSAIENLEYVTRNVPELRNDFAEWITSTAVNDDSPAVRLQGLIFITRRSEAGASVPGFHAALEKAVSKIGDDVHAQRIFWQSLKAYYSRHPELLSELVQSDAYLTSSTAAALSSQLVDWVLADNHQNVSTLAGLVSQTQSPAIAREIVQNLSRQIQTGQLANQRLISVREAIGADIQRMLRDIDSPLFVDAALLATSWKDTVGYAAAQKALATSSLGTDQRLAAANALIAAEQDEVLRPIAKIFDEAAPGTVELRGQLLASLARLDDPEVGQFALHYYSQLPPDLQQKAIELLTQRPEWSKLLLTAIGDKQIPASVLNVNQARKLAESKDETVRELLAKHWGVVRDGRNPDRERVVAEMRAMIRQTPGDAVRGQAVFKKVCAQCHKMYGEGAEVGPDITRNGRNDFTQLLSNVFDPSLVIGSGYQSYTVATEDGRVLNGLLAEDSPQRVVLKVQGGKQEVIARDDIDVFKASELSLMPEQLERQHTPQELADLFAYITLDKPPGDPTAKRLPGVYDIIPRASTNPADFAGIVQEVAPGFTDVRSGEGGVALLAEHMGRKGVVRTHPVSKDQPGRLAREITLPADKKAKLVVEVSHDPRGDWRLVVYAEGRLIDEIVSQESCGDDGWVTYTASLEKFAGKKVTISLLNQANDWKYEFAYWGSVRIEFEE